MSLKKGKSQKVISENISEFHKGGTYAKTKAKYGKETANKQAVPNEEDFTFSIEYQV